MRDPRVDFVAVVVLLLVGQTARAQQDTPGHDISSLLTETIKQHHVPGMAALVLRDSRVVAAGTAGVREQGRPEAIRIEDQFHLGSITKSMTATLCAMLVEEGKLRWDMTLAEGLPDLKDAMLPEFRQVTLAQLLEQRSGFGERIGRTDVWERFIGHGGTLPEARRACARDVLAEKPETPPGSQFHYSNYNYLIDGAIIENATGRPWEEVIQQRLFTPLGMKSAGFGAPGTVDVVDQPRGHRKRGKPVLPGPEADNLPICGPSGTVHCSLLDWGKFAALHATRGDSCPGLLKRESFDTLHRPVKSAEGEPYLDKFAQGSDGYAMGWYVFNGGRLVHTGTNTFWYAVQVVIPDRRVSVLVACNQGHDQAETACQEVARRLVDQFSDLHDESERHP
jgi:CubicO group peptidase (beta-lactamase class C family)